MLLCPTREAANFLSKADLRGEGDHFGDSCSPSVTWGRYHGSWLSQELLSEAKGILHVEDGLTRARGNGAGTQQLFDE